MSFLVACSRAGPSQLSTHNVFLRRALIPKCSMVARRYKGDKAGGAVVSSQAGYLLKRRAKQSTKRRKGFPTYRTLPTAQLDHPLFNPDTVGHLKIPLFEPSRVRNPESVGQPLEISPPENDPLRIFGLPKNLLLEFRLLAKPYTVVRQITRDTIDVLSKAHNKSSLATRLVLTGNPGCGKSFLLLQAVEHCARSNWVVIYIPRGVNLVNSTTPYTYDLRTQTYLQPGFSFQILQRMLTVNKKAFTEITLSEDLVLEKQTVKKGATLKEVVDVAIADRKRSTGQAPLILDAVMKALEVQTHHPVLLAVDEFQALYGKTLYRDPHFVPIHSYHLSVPRLIMEFASGKRAFKKGAILGSISSAQTTNPISLELRDALNLEYLDKRPISPYEKRNQVLVDYAGGLKPLEVPGKLSMEEAAGIFEVWKGVKVFGRKGFPFDEAFLGKYTESSGNARDFVRKGILSSMDA